MSTLTGTSKAIVVKPGSAGACGSATAAADFSGSPVSGTAPLEVTFTDLTPGSPTIWLWAFGDGDTSTDQNPVHIYAAGTYDVSLTAHTSAGVLSVTKNAYVVASSATSCITYDAFGTNYTNSWGPLWDNSSIDNSLLVSSGEAVLHIDSLTNSFQNNTTPANVYSEANRRIRCKIRFSDVAPWSGSPNNYNILATIKDMSEGAYVQFTVRVNGPNAGPGFFMFDPDTNLSFTAVSLSNGTQYEFALDLAYELGFMGLKLWDVGDPEPPSYRHTSHFGPYTPDDLELRFATDIQTLGTYELRVADLQFCPVESGVAVVFDDFEGRTVSNGWGTSTDGHAYGILGGASGLSVGGGIGTIGGPISGNPLVQVTGSSTDAWNAGAGYVMTAIAAVDKPPLGDVVNSVVFRLQDPFSGNHYEATAFATPDSSQSGVMVSGSLGSTHFTTIPPAFWVDGATYTFTWNYGPGSISFAVNDGVTTYTATTLSGGPLGTSNLRIGQETTHAATPDPADYHYDFDLITFAIIA